MLANISPAVHGAFDFAELEQLGIDPNDVLDFSVNSNPFGTSPHVREAILSTPLERYPDRESIALRRALSNQLNASMNEIIVGNGTAELIQLAAQAFLQKGHRALIVEPTFGEYERCAKLAGAEILCWRATPEDGFAFHFEEIEKKLNENPRVAFICNPNNPTGQILPLAALDEWSRSYPDTLFIVDEAYLAFVPDMTSAISLQRENIFVLRSMTKDYAIAGLRLGYAVGSAERIAALANLHPAWNVNALAQAAGLAALQDEAYLSETLKKLRAEKETLISGLKGLGYHPVPSHTNYFLLPVGGGAQFRQKLLKRGILIRDCASFGLPEYVRIATRIKEENQKLLGALENL
jgi:histidinol-phosphate aminotransferase